MCVFYDPRVLTDAQSPDNYACKTSNGEHL